MDKNHVMVALMRPTGVAITVAVLCRVPNPPLLAVFLDRKKKEFTMLEIPQ
jgi:hypothetical protein